MCKNCKYVYKVVNLYIKSYSRSGMGESKYCFLSMYRVKAQWRLVEGNRQWWERHGEEWMRTTAWDEPEQEDKWSSGKKH